MATNSRRLFQLIALASVASLVAASVLENGGVLASFINNTPWLSDLLNLPADGMCKNANPSVRELPMLHSSVCANETERSSYIYRLFLTLISLLCFP